MHLFQNCFRFFIYDLSLRSYVLCVYARDIVQIFFISICFDYFYVFQSTYPGTYVFLSTVAITLQVSNIPLRWTKPKIKLCKDLRILVVQNPVQKPPSPFIWPLLPLKLGYRVILNAHFICSRICNIYIKTLPANLPELIYLTFPCSSPRKKRTTLG